MDSSKPAHATKGPSTSKKPRSPLPSKKVLSGELSTPGSSSGKIRHVGTTDGNLSIADSTGNGSQDDTDTVSIVID